MTYKRKNDYICNVNFFGYGYRTSRNLKKLAQTTILIRSPLKH